MDLGAAFVKAMEVLVPYVGRQEPAETRADVDAPPPTFPQKRADALVAMADLAMSALAADGKPACTADKYQVAARPDNTIC